MTAPGADLNLSLMRSRLGESTALWAREVEVEPGRWKAFSGAFSPRYNLALCHGPGTLALTLDEIGAAGTPAIVMAAGDARSEASEIDLGDWVPIAEMPFMSRGLDEVPAPVPGGCPLKGDEIDRARRLIADVFSLHERLALVALPPGAAERPGQVVWGGFDDERELAACAVTVMAGDCVAIWSMATAPDLRRRGHATRVLLSALAGSPPARVSVLYAPNEAEAFYRSVGYEVLERWQLFSRRRWGARPG